MVDRHSVAQHAADQLGIVPVFGVELFGESFHGGLVSALVLKLEVVALGAVIVHLFDNLTLGHRLGQQDAFLVVLQTGEYLVGIAVQQSYEGHPLVLVVLESYHVALQFLRTDLRYFGVLAGSLHLCLHIVVLGGVFILALLLFFLRHADHHARAASVAIDGTPLAT